MNAQQALGLTPSESLWGVDPSMMAAMRHQFLHHFVGVLNQLIDVLLQEQGKGVLLLAFLPLIAAVTLWEGGPRQGEAIASCVTRKM